MAEYKSIHKGEEIDEAVTRAFNLSETTGLNSNKIMSQKAVTQELQNKVDKVEGKGLSTNDYDDTSKEAVDALGTASKCDTGINEGNVPIINLDGKLDSSILPSLSITDTFTAESQEQMLALNAQKGDICVRTDESKTYILQSEPATEIQNWMALATPTDTVQSVNQKTGIVTLNYEDVGAVQANSKILGETKCKITYDQKGLVLGGKDLLISDIPDLSEIYETKANKSDSYIASSDQTYASTKALVDGLITKAEIKKYYLNLDTLWEADSDGKYYKQIAIDGILETDTPIIDLILSDNAETAKAEIDAWSCVSKITTNNGSIKVYCYEEKPKTQIQAQILCIR